MGYFDFVDKPNQNPYKSTPMGMYFVEIFSGGGWQRGGSLPSYVSGGVINAEMRTQANRYPGCRVRVVDQNGRLVDILS